MTREEYDALQERLTKKAENNPYRRNSGYKRESCYKEGILAAKSILHEFYQRQAENHGQKEAP